MWRRRRWFAVNGWCAADAEVDQLVGHADIFSQRNCPVTPPGAPALHGSEPPEGRRDAREVVIG